MYQRDRKYRRRKARRVIADNPQPVEALRQAPILYNDQGGAPIGGRLQRWANGFTLPGGASMRVRLHRAPTASAEPAGMFLGSTPDMDVVYWDPKFFHGRAGKATMLHELTHRYDRRGMTDATRRRFERIMGDTRPWRSGANSPHEQFAEAASAYMMGYKRARVARNRSGYDFRPNRRQWRQVRRLFDSLD